MAEPTSAIEATDPPENALVEGSTSVDEVDPPAISQQNPAPCPINETNEADTSAAMPMPMLSSEPPPASDVLNWSGLAYELGLQGLAQEIAVNSIVDGFENNYLILKLTTELKELVNPAIEQEIRQAVDSYLKVSCQLQITSAAELDRETPYRARVREQMEHRSAAIDVIKQSEAVRKLSRAFGAELVESSVRRIEEDNKAEVIK